MQHIVLDDSVLWHVDPLLDNGREVITNGYANKHVSTVTIALQQRNGVLYAVRAKML
jgi:hypothetical protein